jgi:hypothetical protein
MKPRDLFIVGVRLIGVWYIALSVDDLRTLIDILIGAFTPQRTPISAYLITFIIRAMIGLFLFLFAHRLADVVSSRVEADDGPPSDE